MDPKHSLQDVVYCTLCQTSIAPMCCEVCHIHLCKDCVEKHLSDSSNVHKVVSLKQYLNTLNYPKCVIHPTKQCELHCEQCDIPICVQCISSGKHLGHKQIEISKTFENKKQDLQRDLKELETIIYPKYKEMISSIPVQKADLNKNSNELATSLHKQGNIWHMEIDIIIKNLISNVEKMESRHLDVLNKQEDEITRTIAEITQSIDELKKLMNSKDVYLVSEYKSRNAEFRRLPPKLQVLFPNFLPKEIHREQLIEQFGSLSELSCKTVEQDYSILAQGAESSPPNRSLMVVPLVITDIKTDYTRLYGVNCFNDAEIWTCGNNSMIKLYNNQGEQVKLFQTESGNIADDIAVTQSGDLVYTDYIDSTVNVVKNTQIQTVIRLRGWRPHGVYSTSSGDLLVVIDSDDNKQAKVVRYSGSLQKQTIQYNDKGQPLYSYDVIKYISENCNLDVCVSDNGARAVVIVNKAGKLRFTYTGPPTTKKQFDPRGITTNSQGRILIADSNNKYIHILNQDGYILRYIDNCDLRYPWGLCVDSRDNLFVAECRTGRIKKIEYSK